MYVFENAVTKPSSTTPETQNCNIHVIYGQYLQNSLTLGYVNRKHLNDHLLISLNIHESSKSRGNAKLFAKKLS